MFDPNSMTTQQNQIYTQQPQDKPDKSQDLTPKTQQQQQQVQQQSQQTQQFPSFCYANVNMIHKLDQPHNSTVNMSQLSDEKCYITQPFSYNYALVNQMNTITFKCEICGLVFTHLTLLNHHKRVHQQEQGAQQQQQTQQITVQVQQQPQQIQIVSADRIRFGCEECGMTFGTQADLKTHKMTVHQQTNPGQGQIQQQPGQQGQQQQQQQQQQTQQQQQQPGQQNTLKIKNCETCGAPLPQDTNKKRAVMKVKCETCLSAESIQPQILFVATAPDSSTTVKFEESTQTQQQQQQQQQQPQQPTNLGSQNSIPIGVKNNHPVKRRGVASVTKCTKCNGSGIIFIGGAKNQQNNVDKPFHCNICNGSFSRYSSLWSHKRLHTGEKNFKCNICGLAFAKAAYLKNHSRIHTGEKPYRCNVCGMQFSQSPHLKNHERIHSGERPYVCEVCDKSFARHSTLWNHRRIHTGEKPYRCDICGSCFNQATHLKNHAKVHSGEKPFKCDICSVGFSDRFALKRHRNIHEKYGRTKPNSVVVQQQNQDPNSVGVENATDATQGGANGDATGGGLQQQDVVVSNADGTDDMVVESKYEEGKYEVSDGTVEIGEEIGEMTELHVQLS